MKLTLYTDYSLRVLIYLASMQSDRLCNIQEISDVYGISKNHLMKVINNLGRIGVIETVRGRNGGFRLAVEPKDVNIGKLVRQTEDGFQLVDCMNPDHPSPCILTNYCGLTHVFREAMGAFLQVLDKYTVADIVRTPEMYQALFQKQLKQSNE